MAENPTFRNREKFRVGGSGFTAFYWKSSPIAFAQSVQVISPKPVAQPYAIQPMDARYPLQVITPGAIQEGYLQVALLELYNKKIWDQMIEVVTGNPNARANDLADVFYTMAAISEPIRAVKVVVPPKNLQGDRTLKPYGEIYHNCVITSIDDGETIEVGSMQIVKQLMISYTHATRTDANKNAPNINTDQPSAGHLFQSNYSAFV